MKRIMGNQLEKDETKSLKMRNEKPQKEKASASRKEILVFDDEPEDSIVPSDSTQPPIVFAFDDSELECIKSLLSGQSSEKYDVDTRNGRLVARWEANRRLRIAGWEAALAKLTLGTHWLTRYSELLLGLCPLAFASETMWLEFTKELLEILRGEGLTGWVALRGSSATFLSIHPEKGCDPDADICAGHYAKGGENGLAQYLHLSTNNNTNSLSKSHSNALANTPANALHYFDCKVHRLGGPESAKQKLKEYQLFEAFSDLDFNIKSPELIKRLKASGAHVSGADVGGNYNQDDTFEELPGLWTLKADWTAKLQRDISFVSIASEKDLNNYSNHPFTFPI
jgi:hypothetical protein